MLPKLHSFCQQTLRLISLFFAALIFAANLYYRVEISYDRLELASINPSIVFNLQVLLVTAGIAAFFCLFRRIIWKIKPAYLFIGLSLVYLLFSANLIFNSCNVLRSDAKSVFSSALQVKNGDYSAFQPQQYMYMYPHQIGLMLFDLLCMTVSENPSFLFFVNSLLVLGINFTTWQISRLLCQDEKLHLLTILLSFMFIPQLFFIMFAYGQIPGLFFLLISIYHTIRYVQTHSLRNMLCLCLSIAVSVLLRKNYLIGACAIGIFLMVDFLRQRNPRMLLAVICLILSLILSNNAVFSFFEAQSETSLDNGCPSILWIAMGTDIDNQVRSAGWYDSSSYTIYSNAQGNVDEAAAQGWEKLSRNVEKMRLRPIETLWFFKNKIVSQWCDPMYQSIWSGPMLQGTQTTYTPFLQSLYSGGDVENAFEAYTKCISLLIWAGALIYLLVCRKHIGWEIPFAYFVGGFLFHLFWEGKSQYVYPYVFCLIPFAAFGLHACLTRKRKKR